MSQIELTPVEQTYKQVVMVAVPRSTAWQPKAAHQLMVSLFGLNDPVTLGIEARANHIQWYLETRTRQVEALVNALYALYPQAQIEIQPKTNAHIGYYLFDLHTATPFVAPLKMAEDFVGLDPLPSVVSALSRLGPDEAILYELSLTGVESEYYQLGEKLITASTVQGWTFLHPAGAILVATKKLTGTDKVEKYVPEIQKPARAKLNSPLQKVGFSLKAAIPGLKK